MRMMYFCPKCNKPTLFKFYFNSAYNCNHGCKFITVKDINTRNTDFPISTRLDKLSNIIVEAQ